MVFRLCCTWLIKKFFWKLCLSVQLHLEPAAPEAKEPKEQEVDWFAEHGKPTNTNDTALQVHRTAPHGRGSRRWRQSSEASF